MGKPKKRKSQQEALDLAPDMPIDESKEWHRDDFLMGMEEGGLLDFEEVKSAEDVNTFLSKIQVGYKTQKEIDEERLGLNTKNKDTKDNNTTQSKNKKKKKNKKNKNKRKRDTDSMPDAPPKKTIRTTTNEEDQETNDMDGMDSNDDKGNTGISADTLTQNKDDNEEEEEEEENDVDTSSSTWKNMGLQPELLRTLKNLKFTSPTPVQQEAIPPGLAGEDMIVGAPTGTGKTLAFGIPLLCRMAARPQFNQGYLRGLILTPTRELAVQVATHLRQVSRTFGIRVAAVVGGLSADRQTKILRSRPEIVVATPGRLWELLSERTEHLRDLGMVEGLVLDEADRMVVQGSFKELSYILGALYRHRREKSLQKDDNHQQIALQTMLFSATLSLPKSWRNQLRGEQTQNEEQETSSSSSQESLGLLIQRVNFSSRRPVIVDLTSESKISPTVTEAKLECNDVNEKAKYLYYFLSQYPSRTLVFVNSISAASRLTSCLHLLRISAYPLHGHMSQQKRLKHLRQFRKSDSAALVTTDVAARGLDIPAVDNVVHFHMPKSTEMYVHRSGRAGRANREGFSLVLLAPSESRRYNRICIETKKEAGMPLFPVDRNLLPEYASRTKIANRIVAYESKISAAKTHNQWMHKMADQAGLDVDPSDIKEPDLNEQQYRELASLKADLQQRLQTRIIRGDADSSFLTFNSQSKDLLWGMLNPKEDKQRKANRSAIKDLRDADKKHKNKDSVAEVIQKEKEQMEKKEKKKNKKPIKQKGKNKKRT